MSRKRLSVRRQNELAALDPDLPLVKVLVLDASMTNTVHEPVHEEQAHDDAQAMAANEPNSIESSSDEHSCESASTSEPDLERSGPTLRESLRNIAIETNMPHSTLSRILRVLNPHLPDLPIDARTLLRTQTKFEIREMGNGRYCHLGLKTGLLKLKCPVARVGDEVLQLMFNVDGVPITKGGEKNFWPILCQVANGESDVFPVGIYEGQAKPACFNFYLSEFVQELKQLVEEGITIDGIKYQVKVHGFVLDAPATASVMYVAPYNAYDGCRKCWAHGQHVGKIVFPELLSDPRTDSGFRNQNCPAHHRGKSVLEDLPINMVEDFPLDPMHLVYLGVVKKMIGLWMKRKRGSSYKLSRDSIADLNDKMLLYTRYYPQEFQRKPRRIDHYKMWKATEFRDFLLYTGPVVLKDVISPSVYKHFMALSTAIRILVSPAYQKYNNAAEDLLKYVVRHFRTLYGVGNMTYNVHGLLHLASDSLKYGQLDSFSAFKFENFLGILKRKLRTSYLPLQQICNRFAELRSISSTKAIAKAEVVFSKPMINTNNFLQADFPAFTITANKLGADCVLMNTGNVVRIVGFIGEKQFRGDIVENVTEFYNKPRSLKDLHNIFSGTFSCNKEAIFSNSDIMGKMVYLPITENTYFFVPIIHSVAK